MKSITTKLIFGAALSIVGIATISPQAWAANRDVSSKFTATGQITDFNRFLLDVKGSLDGIEATDYIEIFTKNLAHSPTLNSLSVKYNNEIIGRIESANTNRAITHVLNKPVDNTVTTDDMLSGKLKIIFNENISKYQIVNFSISNQGDGSIFMSDKPYNIDLKLMLNNSDFANKSQQISPVTPRNYTVSRMIAGGNYLYTNNNNNTAICFEFENAAEKPIKSGYKFKADFSNSGIKLKHREGFNTSLSKQPWFVGADTPKNSNGIYFVDTRAALPLKVYPISGDEVVMEATGDAPAQDTLFAMCIQNDAYTDIDYSIAKPEGRYININPTYETTDLDNISTKSHSARIVIIGSNAEAFLKEKVQEAQNNKKTEEKEKTPEYPKTEESPKQEIKAPNTGFDSGTSALALSVVALLATASAFFFKKK